MRLRRLSLVGLAAAMSSLVVVGSASAAIPASSGADPASRTPRVAVPHSSTVVVSIEKGGYVPNYDAIHTGDVVKFVNRDAVVHEVAFNKAAGISCVPSPVVLQPKGSGQCSFTHVGTFAYSDPKVGGVTYRGTIVVSQADIPATITSSPSATFLTGTQTSFTVEASGIPAPTVTISGTLPAGLGFSAPTPGSATISGEAGGPPASYAVTLLAANGDGPVAKQTFTIDVAQPPAPGYVVAGSSGTVAAYGQAHAGSPVSVNPTTRAIVAVTRSPGDLGYYLVTSLGGVDNLGGAPFYGSEASSRLSASISAFATTPDGKGYWLVAKNGTVYPFGDAKSFSSLSVNSGTRPIVAIASTADGNGYWLASARGNVYDYGDAAFYGSPASLRLPHPIVELTMSASGKGYYLVSLGGNVYNYGDARFYGSKATTKLAHPVVGLTATLDGKGYYLVTSGGNVYDYGDARFYGSPALERHGGATIGLAIPD